MCFTGQRISDSIRIRWTNLTTLNNAKVWIITTKKTSETINVPIPDFAMDVLGKYQDSNNPIPVMSEQYFNRRLKEMAELAGLDRTILIKKIIKGKITEEMVPLYSKISSHIARKSFITNALILGMSETEVKTVSGHKDDRSFRRYVQLAEYARKKVTKTFSRDNIEKYLKGN
jgi:integrase